MKNILLGSLLLAISSTPLADNLPPGLQKKVERGGSLPPGWEKKLQVGELIDDDVFEAAEIVVIDENIGRVTIKIDGKILELAEHTHEIIEILEDL